VWRLAAIAIALLIAAGNMTPAIAAGKLITIGTAGEGGVYYPTGGAVCRLIKRGTKEHGINCSVNTTSGSVYNLKSLKSGELDLAIAQTDWIYHAYKGTSDFRSSGPDKSLRSIFSLHTEAFTVLARGDAGIKDIHDLKHKRIGIGADGSGMLATAEEFIKAEHWDKASFASVKELKSADLGKALCDGTVDAILVTTGHPNGNTQETTSKCSTRLIAVEGEEIDKLMRNNPYYVHVTLPGHMYRGSPSPVNTFGVKATLVTTSHVDEEIIYQVVKAVFGNLDNFKTLHPVFSSLDKSKMVKEGLIVPLHPGALRYYREAGLIK
jgi:TRAP transporter TAXI family solute receptor